MNAQQVSAATCAMVKWLSHPCELGRAPAAILCEKTFSLHGLTYYAFKYKETVFGPWYLGVAGGYEEGNNSHCGHVWSERKEYNSSTAVADATAMVETVIQHWKARAGIE